jgi:hypothetical protein
MGFMHYEMQCVQRSHAVKFLKEILYNRLSLTWG